ncbi:MAG: cupin domain-containing protein [Planctomycetota bacterium]
MTFRVNLDSWLGLEIDDDALADLSWKDFGNGSSMAKLHRDGESGLVLYRIAADADGDSFEPHEHVGGEMYLVLRGAIIDETGRYEKGEIVYLPPGSKHCPRGDGETLVLVLWPAGVRVGT